MFIKRVINISTHLSGQKTKNVLRASPITLRWILSLGNGIRTHHTISEQIVQAPSTGAGITPDEPPSRIFLVDIHLGLHELSGCSQKVRVPLRGVQLS
jgi:hypothetical protein